MMIKKQNMQINILQGEKINGRDYIKIDSCVNIFENGIAYSGSVLINAITEIAKIIPSTDDKYLMKMNSLEKNRRVPKRRNIPLENPCAAYFFVSAAGNYS